MKQVATRVFGLLILAPWAYLAVDLFIRCPWLGSTGSIDLDGFWTAVQRWTYLTLLVLLYVIFFADTLPLRIKGWRVRRANTSNRRTILLGLIGGFAIALPALAITMLAFVTAFPHFVEALRGGATDPSRPEYLVGGQEISLQSEDVTLGSGYFLGVDVSKSVMGGQREQRMEQIQGLVDLLFSRDPERVLDSLIDSADVYWAYAFAGDQSPLAQRGKAFQDIRAASFPLAFKEALDEYLETNKQSGDQTDVLGFLDSILANLKTSEEKYSHVTVLVFSDFYQDAGNQSFVEIKARVRNFMSGIEELGNVHLVGVHVDSGGRSSVGIDIRRYLAYYSRRGLWREISLDRFDAANMEQKKSMLVFNIYREVRQEAPLYLKYQVAPWRPILASVRLPSKEQAYDGILVGLRPARGSDGSTPNVQVVLGEKEPTMLTISGTEASFEILPRMSSAENPISVSLQSRLDVSRSVECELLVAVPSRALVHSIPVVILPVVGDLPMQVLRLALRFIGAILVFLSIGALGPEDISGFLAYRFHRGFRGRRRRSVLGQGDST